MASLNNHDKKHHTSFTSFHHPFPPKVAPVVLQVLVRESPALHDIPLVPPHEIPMAPQCRHEIRRLCVGWSLEVVAADFSLGKGWPPSHACYLIINLASLDGMICHGDLPYICMWEIPPKSHGKSQGIDYSPPFITQEGLNLFFGKIFLEAVAVKKRRGKTLGNFQENIQQSATVMNPPTKTNISLWKSVHWKTILSIFHFQVTCESRWWLNQPIWKICSSQIGSFPQVGMKNNIWNRNLGIL